MYSFFSKFMIIMVLPGGSEVKNVPADAGTACLIPESRRSPGGGHGNPFYIPAWEIPWTEEPGGLQFMG